MNHKLTIFLLSLLLSGGAFAGWEYLDSGTIRIGVDRSRGACIGWFGESETKRNQLNHWDEGRFVQQSYYGAGWIEMEQEGLGL